LIYVRLKNVEGKGMNVESKVSVILENCGTCKGRWAKGEYEEKLNKIRQNEIKSREIFEVDVDGKM
jgi:hypothetical protein